MGGLIEQLFHSHLLDEMIIANSMLRTLLAGYLSSHIQRTLVEELLTRNLIHVLCTELVKDV